MTVIDGILFGGEDTGRINAVARKTTEGWVWWLTTSRWDVGMACIVEEYLDGGREDTAPGAAHALCQATGAMFG